jgi:hypothetical protein
MILGSLRYLGRGWTFDDVEENTGVSAETHRQFFHEFIKIGSTFLYDQYVVPPSTPDEAKEHMLEMEQAGLPGCLGSTDGTHVIVEKCSMRIRNSHLGPKLPGTARSYNATVNHRRRILHTTSGHPCRWNDKTLILFDTFARGIYEGSTALNDVEFELVERDAQGNLLTIKYSGCYLIVDNGYLKWSTTVPPSKSPLTQQELKWSNWLESIRKDVECTFGILKGRWRILKTGVRLHGVNACDKIWKTCCALHNMLLEIDGLDKRWESGIPSDWEGNLGMFETADVQAHVPFAIRRLMANSLQTYDATTNHGDDDEVEVHLADERDPNEDVPLAQATVNGIRIVRHLSLKFFKGRLIEHFDIQWGRNKIEWPSRLPNHLRPPP